jgi:hypothetical protein
MPVGEAARRKKAGQYPEPHVAIDMAAPGTDVSVEVAWPEFTDEARRSLEGRDNMAVMRNRLKAMGSRVGEYAGLPLAVEGEELRIHPSYAFAHIYNKPKPDEAEVEDGGKVRNIFWSVKYRVYVAVVEDKDGTIWSAPASHGNQAGMLLRTMGCSVAWGIEQESKALQLLGTLVRHVPFKYYLLTGMFMETSRRSGLTYIFRKLRPTVVLSPRAPKGGGMRMIAALCMHPIGHYAGCWAGAMCPTDDVVAHLMMMRGDEHGYWKEANQIPPGRHEAGI